MYDINENLNSIISTKNALANVLAENGVQAGNVFSEYPQMFRSVIAAGGGGTSGDVIYAYISDYLSTYNYIDQEALSDCSYITLADVPSVDLSSYVTKAELSGMSYVTSSDLSSASYVTNAQLQSASYVTSSDLSSASYITATYISNHDIIPATNEFYTLGNAAYRYLQIATKHAFVTDDLAFGTQKITHQDTSHSLTVVTNNFDRIIFNNSGIIPASNNSYTLGNSSYEYAATYTSNIYADNAYISNYNNLFWTGTSAQYASLPDYTTYQIYLIQES